MKSYRQSNETWMSDVRFHSPGEFLDGTIISLLVEDPRITRPTHKRKPTPRTAHRKQLSVLDELPVPPSEFWDLNLRCKMLDSKMSQDELQEMRSHNLAPILTTKAKVPVLLIIRNANTGTSSSFTGVDLLLPSGFGMDFWVALQYGTAHAVALRDHRAIHFESDRLCFPTDFVDCVAGSNDLLEETQERVEKYLLRPHNRRIRYWSRLSVKYPFSFNLNELACDWAGETNGGHKLHILRDRKQLLLIERWLLGKAPEPVDLLNSFPLALIPVRLDVLTTGRPVRYALICVPIDSDFDLSRVNNIDKKRVIDEPCNVSVSANEVDDEDCNELANSDGMTESYIELQDHSKEELISLCSLFPDKQQQRKRKILLQRKESRKRSKAAKMQKKAMEYESKEKGGLEPEKEDGDLKSDTKSGLIGSDDMPTFRKSCSREIIGRVMRGSYGLSCGRGKGLGYCTLCGLREVRNRQVLFRNVTSKHYHPALISVLRTLPDL
ncbi:hypothetical protein AB6A40_010213 [Gnathostoma spinigerum]|uniref:POPLD domain-containing protein n=1 Tax=Gnathostoma spinigerum TaxID=75299 RepID=A0ABD6EU52_9BILA